MLSETFSMIFKHRVVMRDSTSGSTKNEIEFFSFPFWQYYKPEGIPARQLDSDVCALCGNQFLVKVGQEGVVENTFRLPCGHE